jgi:hypothetical protein
MAGLVIPSSVTVPVAIEGGHDEEYEEIGDRSRTFNGNMRQTVRAWKSNHRFVTAPVSSATAASIISSLQGSQPLACYGDLIGVSSSTTANYNAQLISRKFMGASTARRSVIEFKLMAS